MHAHPQQPQADVDNEIPACPMSFPQIQAMSVQELRKYLGDQEAFDAYIQEHPHRQYVAFVDHEALERVLYFFL